MEKTNLHRRHRGGGAWVVAAPWLGLLAACGGNDKPSVDAVSPGEIVRTVSTPLQIAGHELPASGLKVTVPGDAKAFCQAPTQMSAGGFKVACKFDRLGPQTLEIRDATRLLGSVAVTVKSNVSGVSWVSPSTTDSGVVRFGETVTFKLAGVNLLADAGLALVVEKCDNPTETGTPGDTLRSFSCTFTQEAGAVAGEVVGAVRDAPGGQVLLGGWKVPVEVPASRLPDTGIAASQCYAAGRNTLVSCTSAAAIALNSQQDGMIGRDVTNPASTDGKLGSSYSEVSGYARTECVKDNITGLIWEGKPTSGLRANTKTYTNYGDNRPGDASAYAAAVNAAALCGYTDWRLPTADELQSIVDYGVAWPGPTVDADWFPNTVGLTYWSSSPSVGNAYFAWFVGFDYGYVSGMNRSYAFRVRLVR